MKKRKATPTTTINPNEIPHADKFHLNIQTKYRKQLTPTKKEKAERRYKKYKSIDKEQ